MKRCINVGNVITLLFLSAKLLKFEIQKCGQILCAHKPYFLMPGHIYKNTWCILPILSGLRFTGMQVKFSAEILYTPSFKAPWTKNSSG